MHCNIHIATCCNTPTATVEDRSKRRASTKEDTVTLQHALQHILQHTATHCNTPAATAAARSMRRGSTTESGGALEHTHCNALQHTYCNSSSSFEEQVSNKSGYPSTATHTATCCNILQHTCCNSGSSFIEKGFYNRERRCTGTYTLQRTATHLLQQQQLI